MKKLINVLLCTTAILIAFAASVCVAEDREADRKTLDGLMEEAIQLLEDEKYELFIAKFGPPGVFYGVDVDDKKVMLRDFENDEAMVLLRVFKKASKNPPRFYMDGNIAVYSLEQPLNYFHRLAWAKHRGLWFPFDRLSKARFGDEESLKPFGDPE